MLRAQETGAHFNQRSLALSRRANESEVTRDLSLLWMVISRRPILQLLWL